MKYKKNKTEDITEYEVDETGAMLYVSSTEETHILNDTAYFLYKLLEKPADIKQLYQELEQVYEISEAQRDDVLNDIKECLDMLYGKNLICIDEERID